MYVPSLCRYWGCIYFKFMFVISLEEFELTFDETINSSNRRRSVWATFVHCKDKYINLFIHKIQIELNSNKVINRKYQVQWSQIIVKSFFFYFRQLNWRVKNFGSQWTNIKTEFFRVFCKIMLKIQLFNQFYIYNFK